MYSDCLLRLRLSVIASLTVIIPMTIYRIGANIRCIPKPPLSQAIWPAAP